MARATLADICRSAGPDYCRRFGERILPSHRRALSDIAGCRTPALGGHLSACPDCGALDYAYHSCRNRHCPRCERERASLWAEKLRRLLLPGRYALLTFTIPAELRALARAQQRTIYPILLREAAAAVLTLAADPRWVGGRPGIVAVLHTWTRDLAYHPHVHLLVTAGGLAGDSWQFPVHRDFLMPGRLLGPIFRRRVCHALARAGLVRQVNAHAWRRRWVVHVQDAGTGHEVVSYLSRYIYRVALSDRAIESFDGADVTFSYRMRGERNRRAMTLPAEDFLARFLQHVLPSRFVKVRYFGLFASNQRKSLSLARRLVELHEAITAVGNSRTTAAPSKAVVDSKPAVDPRPPTCRVCGFSPLVRIRELPPRRGPP